VGRVIFKGRAMTNSRLGRNIDTGLLILRVGSGISTALLFILRQSEGARLFLYHPDRLWPLVSLCLGAGLVTLGFLTRPAACTLASMWAWAIYSGLHLGQSVFKEPVRSALFSILYFTLFLSGGGRFSIDTLARRRETEDVASAPV
jgi:uncharacterized membrane protein YphA (DoxX/SURF4 family)